ncbi:MAG: crotonase/enoyl-CoA hydratase family protein [Myxococcota bacterium]
MWEHFEVEQDGRVARITMTGRTMPPAFFGELASVCEDLAGREDLRAVVLRGTAKAFSYGLDLPAAFKEHGPLLSGGGLAGPRTELLGLIRRWQGAMGAVAALPVPVVAAVHGWCIGGGLDLASACDVRLASKVAKFSLRETRVAMVADLGSLQRLPGIIGQGNLRELAFTGRDVDAERALEMGLVNRVLPDRESLDEAATDMAEEIAANPPLAVRGVKEVLRFGEGKPMSEGLEYVAAWNAAFLQSEDLAEAVSAFMARREPDYKGG